MPSTQARRVAESWCMWRRCPRHDSNENEPTMSTYIFEPGHTKAGFRARHMMVTWVNGLFKDIHGKTNCSSIEIQHRPFCADSTVNANDEET